MEKTIQEQLESLNADINELKLSVNILTDKINMSDFICLQYLQDNQLVN